MDPKDFINKLERDEIALAIKVAEETTSGEIRVFITSHEPPNIMKSAQAEFKRLGMEQTRDRNGVLIYVAPMARKFSIIGDQGVHEKCGDSFWSSVAGEMQGYFRKEQFTVGIKHGIIKAGELLAEHFPPGTDDPNQLSNEVETD